MHIIKQILLGYHMKRSFFTVTIISAILAAGTSAYAVEQDIGASVQFRQALALSNVQDMEYGIIEYTATAAANNIDLGSDGSLTMSDSAEYSAGSTGTAGALTISGTTGQTVEISCETTGAVSDGTNSLALTNTVFSMGGSDTNCAGLGTSPLAHVLTGSDNLTMGARLEVSGSGIAAPGVYNTSNAGGDAITVRVVYQ